MSRSPETGQDGEERADEQHADPPGPPSRPRPGVCRAAAGTSIPFAVAASRFGTVASCTAIAVAVLIPDLLDHVAVAVALTGIVLGVPHGAVDHMVEFWSTGTRPRPRELAVVLAGYLLVAVAAAVALLVAPAPMVLLFLGVSAVHFGRGEVTFAEERAARPTPRWHTDLSVVLAHGGVVVLLPLTLWHDRAVPALAALAPSLAHPVPRVVLLLIAGGVAAAACVVVGRLARAGRGREAAELALVLALFAVVPPLVAFGVYFGAWHAVRHTGRLLALPGPDGPLAPGAALRRYLVHAAAPTVVALAALVAAGRLATVSSVPVALAVLLALTFPHLRTVARQDRVAATRPRATRQG